MYTKLLNCAYTANIAPEFKLFSLKQIAFCNIKMKEYDTALLALKKEL